MTNFEVKKLNTINTFYGFECENFLYIAFDGSIQHNSGKSVLEQSIVGHVSRYSDYFQLVGVDCKRVEFNLLRGVRGVKGVALDVPTAAAAVENFRIIMMDRFAFMERMQVNSVFKINDTEVDYYEVFGKSYQFDEIFELIVDLDKDDRLYEKKLLIFPDGREPKILTIESIYKGVYSGEFKNPKLPEVKGYNSYIDKNSIRKTKGIYKPKALIFLADELNELMTSEDYRSVELVKNALGSIARLGRAAAVHLALACQRASGNTINSDLKNNIQMGCLLGGFDGGSATLMFEKDISHLAKPEIKGRGFVQTGNEIIETQTYFTQPELDWEFDESMKITYDNPVFLDYKKKKKETVDNSGFIEQKILEQEDINSDIINENIDEHEDKYSEYSEDIDTKYKADINKFKKSIEDVKKKQPSLKDRLKKEFNSSSSDVKTISDSQEKIGFKISTSDGSTKSATVSNTIKEDSSIVQEGVKKTFKLKNF